MGIFAERLKTAMADAEITSAQLSKQTGIGRSSISQWLSSKYVAKHDKVTALATVLKVEPDWLVGEPAAEKVVVKSATPAATTPSADNEVATPIDPQLLEVWVKLSADDQAKLLKKAKRLLTKEAAPAVKPKSKSKSKRKKKKGKKRK